MDEDLALMLVCRSQCEPSWLASHRDGNSYTGPIAKGMIFEWEPDRPWACETIEVTAIEPGRILSKGNRILKQHWNDEVRFREAVVPSLLRFFPEPSSAGKVNMTRR